jgi:hypothetical protein
VEPVVFVVRPLVAAVVMPAAPVLPSATADETGMDETGAEAIAEAAVNGLAATVVGVCAAGAA